MSTQEVCSVREDGTEKNLLTDEQPAIQARMPESRQKQTAIGKLMKMKQNYLKVGLALTALTLLPLGHRAMAGDQVPFKGVEVGAATFVSFDFPFVMIRGAAEGVATQLGHYTITGISMVNVLSATAIGTLTITAANGDMLFVTSEGHALQPASLQETVDNFTITGGTGRFEGATGSWVSHSHFELPFGGTGSNPYVATLVGTISTPGANKK
jgi:hypothetical protein